MALTQFIRVSATIVDSNNVEGVATCYAMVDPGSSITAIIAFYNAWLANLDALVDGQIIGASWTVLPALPGGLKSSPVAGSSCMGTGILNFKATGSINRWGFAIPVLSKGATVQSGGKFVITNPSPGYTMYSFLLATGTALEWSNAAGQTLSSFTESLLSFRKYSKQLAGLSIEV